MKTALTTFILATAIAAADPSDYVNFVRQIQQDSGVEWDVSVAPSGEMLSPEGVGPSGSLFQLWSIHITTAAEYLLDEEFVSAYSPGATITITTGDPYDVIPRTRVDQPFTVAINVDGLVGDSGGGRDGGRGGADAADRETFLSHEAFNYPEGDHSLDNVTDPEGVEVASAYLDGNGSTVLNYPATSLTGPDLTKVEGEETWTVFGLESGRQVGEVLESQKLQIWPIADATISGTDPAVRYSNLPPITIQLRDLYPASETFVRIYPGPPVMEATEFTEIPQGFVSIVDSIPQDRTVVLTGIDDYFVEEGAHTMEIIHVTPFGTDLLTQYYPIRVDRTVEFRGGLYTQD